MWKSSREVNSARIDVLCFINRSKQLIYKTFMDFLTGEIFIKIISSIHKLGSLYSFTTGFVAVELCVHYEALFGVIPDCLNQQFPRPV